MALEIKGLQRVFKIRKGSSEIELADPDNSLSPNEVMDFYSMTYPELTTASVHGPECEDDSVVYRFKSKHSINSPFHSKNVILLL